jgi:hypothetical protein
MAPNQRFLDENGGIHPAIASDLTSLCPGRAHSEQQDQKNYQFVGLGFFSPHVRFYTCKILIISVRETHSLPNQLCSAMAKL